MSKVTIEGFNYEGAHFRGIPSDTDGTYLRVTLVGSENRICDWILENLSYGSIDEITTVNSLVDGYANGHISNFDGCGGVVNIYVDDNAVYSDEWFSAEDEETVLELGEVDVDGDFTWGDLNELVRERKFS